MVKQVQFLNVGDFETDKLITDFGIKLNSFSKRFDVNGKILRIHEPIDFLDASIIHIIHDIKIDLIALHALKEINSDPKLVYKIELQNKEVAYSFYRQASQKMVSIVNYPKSEFWRMFRFKVSRNLKNLVYQKYREIKQRTEIVQRVNPSRNTDGQKILFESNYVNSLHTLLPLVKKLQDRPDISSHYVLVRKEAYEYLANIKINGIELLNPVKYGKIDVRNLKYFVDEFVRQHFADVSTAYFKTILFTVLLRNFRQALAIYQPLKRVLLEYNPDAIVLCTGSSVDARLLIQLAKKRDIPDYVLVHGLLWDTPVIAFNNCSVKFVWSEHQAQMMKKYAPSVKSIVTGSPKHSAIKTNLEKAGQKSIIEGPYILYATTPPNNVLLQERDYMALLKSYADASKQFKHLKFVIKLHPSEDITKVEKRLHQVDGPKSDVIILKAEDTYNLLYFATMVMVVSSTTGFEAVYFEKPLIIYETGTKAFYYPFKNEAFVKVINSTEMLIKAIEENILNKKIGIPSEIKRKYFLDNPSASTDILDMIASGIQ